MAQEESGKEKETAQLKDIWRSVGRRRRRIDESRGEYRSDGGEVAGSLVVVLWYFAMDDIMKLKMIFREAFEGGW